MPKKELSRREFLKLSGLGLLGLMMPLGRIELFGKLHKKRLMKR